MYCKVVHDAGMRVFGTYQPYTMNQSSTGRVFNFDIDFVAMLDLYFAGDKTIVMDKSQLNFINGYCTGYAQNDTDNAIGMYGKFDEYLSTLGVNNG